MVVANAVTTLLANLSVTSDKKVALIVQLGQMNPTTMMTSRTTKKDESLIEQQKKMDGTEIEREPEMLEFDDFSEVDYDLDYTVQY
ncbi:hypothetical protein SWTG_00023 [Synechococcus phage S-RIM2 R1_1999]|uniref:Uncharacterized protein n=3 Tax=Nerrivikvirus srim2 TaxID=2734125 RepID=M4PXV7_9CAUD|nr:hypothetical protein SWTG_00023 [Synechococcus phage S-RIM2 R1_1999]AGH06733.1 hypothetical protein SWRG_00039 [Synechococcus phage S-RIM2 R21_2007]AGH06944.1 hypothetical protein SWUG_00034 [Synechococcus phage S-RIM2 R9_2006]AGH07154.1 hypothetical protein SWTG_00023 [Synechococcus phage S-RIM2 R1_1999]